MVLGTANLVKGVATITLGNIQAGANTITATYNGLMGTLGVEDFAPSTSPTGVPITIGTGATATAMALGSGNPSSPTTGQPVTFTATVTDTSAPSVVLSYGTVTFYSGTTALATVNLSKGVATAALGNIQAGANTITATYNGLLGTLGVEDFAPSTSPTGVPITIGTGATATAIALGSGATRRPRPRVSR